MNNYRFKRGKRGKKCSKYSIEDIEENDGIVDYKGTNKSKNGFPDMCNYCRVYYKEDCFLGELDYCINCWCVMDSDNLNFVDELTYNSKEVNIDDVVKFIKKHYKNYILNGPKMDIKTNIFAKIKTALENDKINILLKNELNENKVKKDLKNLEEYLKYPKKRNPKVNLDLSVIII